jgi:hypothetical protein
MPSAAQHLSNPRPVRLSPKQAAVVMNIHPSTVRKLVSQNLFTIIPFRAGERGVGKRYYLHPDEVEIYATQGEEALREFRARKKRLKTK